MVHGEWLAARLNLNPRIKRRNLDFIHFHFVSFAHPGLDLIEHGSLRTNLRGWLRKTDTPTHEPRRNG